MLVSVTERTREIGLRKAVGAKTFDILLQFIFESVLLTLIGGIFGIGLGILIGSVAGRFLDFQPVVTSFAILLAVGVSSGVGIVFGIYPAAKAARLNPIDALRYE
jgi:putative ABC transport system permease protein